jgi:hypothetical protein
VNTCGECERVLNVDLCGVIQIVLMSTAVGVT